MYKKADAGLTAIVIIVVILVFLSWLVNISQRECQSNKDCSDEQYCGSDFACHKIPVIVRESNPVVVQRDFTGAAWIIGIALVVTAIIFNFDRIFPRRRGNEKVYSNAPLYYEKQSSK